MGIANTVTGMVNVCPCSYFALRRKLGGLNLISLWENAAGDAAGGDAGRAGGVGDQLLVGTHHRPCRTVAAGGGCICADAGGGGNGVGAGPVAPRYLTPAREITALALEPFPARAPLRAFGWEGKPAEWVALRKSPRCCVDTVRCPWGSIACHLSTHRQMAIKGGVKATITFRQNKVTLGVNACEISISRPVRTLFQRGVEVSFGRNHLAFG